MQARIPTGQMYFFSGETRFIPPFFLCAYPTYVPKQIGDIWKYVVTQTNVINVIERAKSASLFYFVLKQLTLAYDFATKWPSLSNITSVQDSVSLLLTLPSVGSLSVTLSLFSRFYRDQGSFPPPSFPLLLSPLINPWSSFLLPHPSFFLCTFHPSSPKILNCKRKEGALWRLVGSKEK